MSSSYNSARYGSPGEANNRFDYLSVGTSSSASNGLTLSGSTLSIGGNITISTSSEAHYSGKGGTFYSYPIRTGGYFYFISSPLSSYR